MYTNCNFKTTSSSTLKTQTLFYSHVEEMCIYVSYISADSDLLHSPFEDVHVVEIKSDDQQGINNELKQGF